MRVVVVVMVTGKPALVDGNRSSTTVRTLEELPAPLFEWCTRSKIPGTAPLYMQFSKP